MNIFPTDSTMENEKPMLDDMLSHKEGDLNKHLKDGKYKPASLESRPPMSFKEELEVSEYVPSNDIEGPISDEKLSCEEEDTNMPLIIGQFHKQITLDSCPETTATLKEKFVVSEYVTSSEDFNFRIKLGRKSISICKPLFPLKIILFFWYGANSYLIPFLTIYYKQRGISLAEISTGLLISPVVQFCGTLLSGIIADKIGRSKPVLLCNIILTSVSLIGILLIPPMNVVNCGSQAIDFKCHFKELDRLITKTSCNVVGDIIEVSVCNISCPANVTKDCEGENSICDIFFNKEEIKNFSLSIHVNGSIHVKDGCHYNIAHMSLENVTYTSCYLPRNCTVSCLMDHDAKCKEVSDRHILMMSTMILTILLMIAFSNGFRMLDVTVMCLIKEHNSDFGRQRFFSMAGHLVISPIAGYLVNVTSNDGDVKNYNSAFYLYFAMCLIVLLMVYKLDVRTNAPGKKMMKKTARLLKNPDIISFALILLVLGTSWSFLRYYLFWYLEEMKPPSILLGLILASSSLYGLPFLFTSNWWMKKIGARQIFIFGLIGYVINFTGYSYITDPWISLILEATNIVTYHLLWVAVVTHSHELAPDGLTASVISIAGSIHYQIGKSTGSLIGGLIMHSLGGRVAFRAVAVICAISAILYTFYLFIRRKYYGKKLPKDKSKIED